MAFRGGRGRGRGRGGYGGGYNATSQAFTLFPADVALPDRKCVALNDDFVRWNHKLQMFFANSPYFVEESTSQDCQNRDIERYSDSLKPRNNKRKSLSDYIKLGPGYFPQDLVGKGRKQQQQQKKVKWDAGLDGKRLNFLEQLEKKAKTNGEKGNDEDEEEEDDEEEDEEYSTDGDYEQNQDFDDDDDDFNDNDDGDDEPFY